MLVVGSHPYRRLMKVVNMDHDSVMMVEDHDSITETTTTTTTTMRDLKQMEILVHNYGKEDLVSSDDGAGEGQQRCWTIFQNSDIVMVHRRQCHQLELEQLGSAASNKCCFLHAPGVVQCYTVQKGSGEYKAKMMDICNYVRSRFDSQALSSYIIGDNHVTGAGDSLEILGNIVQTDECQSLFSKVKENNFPAIFIHLQKQGAALVSKFRVDRRFANYEAQYDEAGALIMPFFDGQVATKKSEIVGSHAMVLVGMRQVEGTWRLLLQNWWSTMPFVEMTGEYFCSSGATLTFVGLQTGFPEHVQTIVAKYAESMIEGGNDIALGTDGDYDYDWTRMEL
jgi:hypothetical protein